MGRVGLGIKSANTAFVIKKVLGEANTNGKGKAALGAKPNTAVKLTSGNEKPVMKKKVITSTTGVNASKATVGKGKSSLKRAAGVVGSTNARVGLAGIGRMR